MTPCILKGIAMQDCVTIREPFAISLPFPFLSFKKNPVKLVQNLQTEELQSESTSLAQLSHAHK